MQSLFFSSRIEEEKRRDFLLGSRRFRFGGTEFYYSYSSTICRLKERILRAAFSLGETRASLDPLSRDFESLGRRLKEADASAALDHYEPSFFLRQAYRHRDRVLKFPLRKKPCKNLSTEAGFSIASRFNGIIEISDALERAKETLFFLKEEDSLLRGILFHFLFEYIHPYAHGNGLAGRFLLTESFLQGPYSPIADSLSAYFLLDRQGYFLFFKRSEAASAHGNLNPYLEGILGLIADGAEKELASLKETIASISYEERSLLDEPLTEKERRVGAAFIRMRAYRPSKVTLRSLASMLGLSERTFYRCLASLKMKGIRMKNALSD